MKRKLDKKDKQIIKLKEEEVRLLQRLNYRETEISELKGELKEVRDNWNRYKQMIEGKELPALAENHWLRETLRMVVVSADKFEALVKKDPLNYRSTL